MSQFIVGKNPGQNAPQAGQEESLPHERKGLTKMFMLRDEKSGRFEQPFCAPVEIDALRTIHQMTTGQNAYHMSSRYPADFRLYKVGTFEPSTGRIEMTERFQDMGTVYDIQQGFGPTTS